MTTKSTSRHVRIQLIPLTSPEVVQPIAPQNQLVVIKPPMVCKSCGGNCGQCGLDGVRSATHDNMEALLNIFRNQPIVETKRWWQVWK